MEENKIQQLTKLYGALLDTTAPSGKRFIIREQNGEDDDLLDGLARNQQSKVNLFLCSIIVWTDANEAGRFDSSNIGSLLINDKYFILLQSRIFSIGPILKFSYRWESGQEYDYEEDLKQFVWDFSESNPVKFPYKGDEGYFEFRVKPYKLNFDPYKDKPHFETTSGKKVKFRMTDVSTEKNLLERGIESTSKNDDFKARGMELEVEGKYILVKNFKVFTKKEMIEIHSFANSLEKPFFAFSQIDNPDTGESIFYPLMADPAFFFPLGI